MNNVTLLLLGYDSENKRLQLSCSGLEISPFESNSFYKLYLKRYAYSVDDGIVLFRDNLSYVDYKKIIGIIDREAQKRDWQFTIHKQLSDYIEQKELYIETRAKLGVEIKRQEGKLISRFMEYQTVVDNSMARKLREKQMWDSFFMCAMQKSSNFSVPGSGKTASVLGVYAYLKAKEYVSRILVVCPKNAFGSWIDEFSICFDSKESLNLFQIHDPKYQGTTQKRNAIRFDTGNANLLLFNYESISNHIADVVKLVDSNTLLVFDEVHKIKKVMGYYASQALTLARNATYVIAMTGTPIPNSYNDIYNLFNLLFPDEYNDFFGFDDRVLTSPSNLEIENINKKIQPFYCRTSKQQLMVPPTNQDKIIQIDATERENKLLEILFLRYQHNRLALIIRILQMETNPALLLKALDLNDFRYLLNNFGNVEEIDFEDYSDEVLRLINSISMTTKMQTCLNLTVDIVSDGKPLVLWCIFIDSIHRISKFLQERGISTKCIYGEVPLEERQQILQDFKNGRFQVLITNPHTLAESVSLHSVCHDALYFEYGYNLVHLLQSKDRIHRLGLLPGQYTQYYFLQIHYDCELGKYSLDYEIYDRLLQKEQTMLNAIDNNYLEILPNDEQDFEKIFVKLFAPK